VNDIASQLRSACARVATSARYVSIDREAIPAYAACLQLGDPAPPAPDPQTHLSAGAEEVLAAFWLTLDAINFGSGWFPTIRKRAGRSGYHTVAAGITDRFAAAGPWTARELTSISAREIADTLGQDPEHELMALFARSLNDLGGHVADEHKGHFHPVVKSAGTSALALAGQLASWDCFADVSIYDGVEVPFYKRAQIAAADLEDAGLVHWQDRDGLTMFADNLVPHVLRLDGILSFAPDLLARIDRGELIAHGAPEEVEIRACAVHAVELIVAARSDTCATEVDRVLWSRGGGPGYKSSPRHRSRCTAY